MTTDPITAEEVLAVIRDPQHAKRTLWTASVVLDRMGKFRRFESQENYSRRDRIQVKRILEDLHASGVLRIVKARHTLHSASGTAEVAYDLAEMDQ